MKLAAVVLGMLAGVLLIWSVLVVAEHPAAPDGVSYGSVWHCRPGHGAPTGGDLTDAERTEQAGICQESRRPRWEDAVTLARAGAVSGLAAGVVGAVSMAARRRKELPVPR